MLKKGKNADMENEAVKMTMIANGMMQKPFLILKKFQWQILLCRGFIHPLWHL